MVECYDICTEVQTAKLLVISKSGSMVSVHVSGAMLEEIAGVEVVGLVQCIIVHYIVYSTVLLLFLLIDCLLCGLWYGYECMY